MNLEIIYKKEDIYFDFLQILTTSEIESLKETGKFRDELLSKYRLATLREFYNPDDTAFVSPEMPKRIRVMEGIFIWNNELKDYIPEKREVL